MACDDPALWRIESFGLCHGFPEVKPVQTRIAAERLGILDKPIPTALPRSANIIAAAHRAAALAPAIDKMHADKDP